MSVIYWRGDSPAVAQVSKVTATGTVGEGTQLALTINGKSVTGTATADTVANLLALTAEAWNDSRVAEFAEVTATYGVDANGDPYILLTADTPGKPFTVTAVGSITVDVDTITEGTPGTNEVQSFYFTSAPVGGVFTITWNLGSGDEVSAAIAWNANAAAVKAAIVSGMASVGSGDITVTGSGTQASPFVLTLVGSLAATPVAQLTVQTGDIVGGDGVVTVTTVRQGSAGSSDQITWVYSLYEGSGPAQHTTFRITVNGQSTAPITLATSTAAVVQSALEALSTVGAGNVLVYGKYDPNQVHISYVLHFVNDLAGTARTVTAIGLGASYSWIQSETLQAAGQATSSEYWIVTAETAATGNFTLSHDSNTTGNIAVNSGQTTMLTELEGLASIGSGNVDVFAHRSNAALAVRTWVIRFKGTLAGTNVPDLTIDDGGVSGGTIDLTKIEDGGTAPGVNEIQEVYTNGTGGTFTLSHSAATTNAISAVAATATLQAELTGILGTGNVSVPSGSGTSSDPWRVEFIGSNASTNVAQITGNGSELTGTVSVSVTTVVDGVAATGEVQTITLTGATGGTFTLSFKDKETGPLAYNVSAANMQTALRALSSIGGANVNVSGSSGGPYTVTFVGSLTGINQPQIVSDPAGLTGSAAVTPAVTLTTPSAGPAHADDPGNYSGGALPTNGDTLIFRDNDHDCLYGLDALNAVTLDLLAIYQSYTGTIGLPLFDGDGGYFQYRDRYFEVSATAVQIGVGDGSGSGRIMLDLGSVATTVNVLNSGPSASQGVRAVILKGTNAANVLNVVKGSVDVAPDQGTVSTLATVRVAYLENEQGDSDVRIGEGVTLTDVRISGGRLELNSDTTTIEQFGGQLVLQGGAHAAIVSNGGLLDWRTIGEITELSASNTFVDCAKDPRPKAFDSAEVLQLYRGATLNDPMGTLPTGIAIRDNTGGVTIVFPPGKTYEVS